MENLPNMPKMPKFEDFSRRENSNTPIKAPQSKKRGWARTILIGSIFLVLGILFGYFLFYNPALSGFIKNIGVDIIKLGLSGATWGTDAIITLTAPTNNTNSTTRNVYFNASITITSGAFIENVSLWHNATGTWHRNQTVNINTSSFLYEYFRGGLQSLQIYDNEYGGQTFIVGNTTMENKNFNITKVGLLLRKEDSIAYNLSVLIYAVDGDRKPTGSFLVWALINATEVLNTSYVWYNISLNGTYELQASTEYALVVNGSGDPSFFTNWHTNRTPGQDPYAGGKGLSSSNSGNTWNLLTEGNENDRCFEIYGDEIVKQKVTDYDASIGENISNSQIWTYEGCDSDGDCGFGENRTLNYDSTPPNWVITSPLKREDYGTTYYNLSLNWTVTDPEDNLAYCWYQYNLVNITMPCGNQNITFNATAQTNLTFFANDTVGNQNMTVYNWDYKIWENAYNYSTITTEGNNEPFKLNITWDNSSHTNIQVNLYYNNTAYLASSSGIGNELLFTKNLNIPRVSSNINITLYWTITLINSSGNFKFNSSSRNQSVNNINIDDCTVYSTLILNMSLKDEETQNWMDAVKYNSSVEVDVDIYPIGKRGTPIIEYSQNYSAKNITQVCLDNDLINSTYEMYAQIRYEANSYAEEFYNMQNVTLTNSTIPQQITLYDLLDADSTEFLIIFKDENFIVVANALVDIQRKYVSKGVFKTVEIPKTDDSGQALGHFDLVSVLYTIMITKNGKILAVFNNTAVVCQDQVTGDCRLNLNAPTSSHTFEDWDRIGGITHSINFDVSTKTITSSFSTTDGSTKTIILNTIKYDRWGNDTVCSDTITSSSGTLTCIIPASYGNVTVVSQLLADGELITTRIYRITPDMEEYFGKANAGIMVLIMLITIPLMLSSSTIGVILGIFFGIGMAIALMLYTGASLFGVGSLFTWIVIAGGILIWKIAKRGG